MDAAGRQLMVLVRVGTGQGTQAVLGGAPEAEAGEEIQLWMLYVGLRDTNHGSTLVYKAVSH